MIQYLILDLDGTLTDSSVYFDEQGNELKKFNSKDFLGLRIAIEAGMNITVVAGEERPELLRRLTKSGLTDICTNVRNKNEWLQERIEATATSPEMIGYIGDDIDDITAMMYCGFAACPADADPDVQKIVDYVSDKKGGEGAVRDIIEWYLMKEEMWYEVI